MKSLLASERADEVFESDFIERRTLMNAGDAFIEEI
jgi:hypothetical protein